MRTLLAVLLVLPALVRAESTYVEAPVSSLLATMAGNHKLQIITPWTSRNCERSLVDWPTDWYATAPLTADRLSHRHLSILAAHSVDTGKPLRWVIETYNATGLCRVVMVWEQMEIPDYM